MLEATRWEEIDWKKVQSAISKKQNEMYRATLECDVTKVRRLQRDIIRDDYAKILAVRKVTMDNKGKFTAGIDGETITNNRPPAKVSSDRQIRY